MTRYQQLSEVELIDRINNGDITLFGILIRRFNPYLYKVGRSYRFNHEDVEDLMQETFINAYKSLGKLENSAYFKTWLIRIMMNECYKKSHKEASRNKIIADSFSYEKNVPMFSDSSSSDTEKNVSNRELNRVIEKAIKLIPLDYRLVFILRELNGMNIHETAEVLNITETNVKVRLNRAKAMLRKKVEKMYSPEEIYEFDLVYCDKMVSKVMEVITNYSHIQGQV